MDRIHKSTKPHRTTRGERIPAVLVPLDQTLVQEILAERGTVRDHLRRRLEVNLGLPLTREELVARELEQTMAPPLPAPPRTAPTHAPPAGDRPEGWFWSLRRLTPGMLQRRMHEWLLAVLVTIEFIYIVAHTAADRLHML